MQELIYHSTRDTSLTATASEAILRGIAPDGGLYVPSRIPALKKSFDELSMMSYPEVAYEVLRLFLTDFTDDEVRTAVNSAYNSDNFDREDITCLMKANGTYYLELFHGRTIAFKDMALSILPHLMSISAKKNNLKEKIVILTATSGDTGKAALEGFANVPGTGIVVFYPKDGVSSFQERQMVTQEGDNTHVIGIHGNFDDAQREVKKIFTDDAFAAKMKEAGYVFSSANSINIGRLIPQIAYYVYAYTRLMEDEITFVVPTGNFGNILAAYYACRMGVPVSKLICASNDNKVLFDFFETGVYDRNRDFILTSSPSMDILISSNLERLIFELAGDETGELMKSLASTGRYEVKNFKAGDTDTNPANLFRGEFATGEEMAEEIRHVYKDCGYVLDPHTAVASASYRKYLADTRDLTPTVIASTASPYKFSASVLKAIEGDAFKPGTDKELIERLNKLSGVEIPAAVERALNGTVRHNTVCDPDKMKDEIAKIFLG